MDKERRRFLRIIATGTGVVATGSLIQTGAFTSPSKSVKAKKKLLIAHRGACAYSPENTLESFRLAIKQGADFIEHDLHITKDGVLVCLHDMTLERTTNVEEVFPDRARTESLNGQTRRRWYVYDFTVAELKRLDAGSWFDPKYKDVRIPTWQETIDDIRGKAGLYIETKSPDFYGSRGFDMERMVLDQLKKNGLDGAGADSKTPLLIQTFIAPSLKKMALELKTRLPLGLLIGESMRSQWLSPEGLSEASKFVSRIGPEKTLLDRSIIDQIHKLGMTVAPYTFRTTSIGTFKNVKDEMAHYLFNLGVDGAITDNPDQFPARG